MKLELTHLAPYLPYGLKIFEGECLEDNNPVRLMNLGQGRSNNWIGVNAILKSHTPKGYSFYRPILHPLSDLVESIHLPNVSEFNVVPVEIFDNEIDGWCDAYDEWWNLQYPDFTKMMPNAPYEVIQKLLEWHFDIFGLIEKGLAIDINTVTP